MSETRAEKEHYYKLFREACRLAKKLSIKGVTAKDSLIIKMKSLIREMKIIDAYRKVKAKS